MKKVIAVSALAMAGTFSAQTLTDESKTGFYTAGKAGAPVMSLSEQRFVDGERAWADKYRGGDKSGTVFGAGLAVGYDSYQHYNVPVRTEVGFYGRGNAESEYRPSCQENVGGTEFGDTQSKSSVDTLMLNTHYDFRNSSVLASWISVGLGHARVYHKTSYVYTGNSLAGNEVYSVSALKYESNLAWSLDVGVKYDVTQDFSLDLSCRYLNAGDSTLTYRDEDGAKYKSSVDTRSSELILGVTYSFRWLFLPALWSTAKYRYNKSIAGTLMIFSLW